MAPSDGVGAARAMTLASGVLWGTSFVTIQLGLEDGFGPVVFVGVRFVFAAASALVVALAARSFGRGLWRDPLVWALGLTNAGGFAFQYWSLDLTTATKTALISNLSLVLVAPMSYWWFRERFDAFKTGALVTMVPGVFLLTTGGDLGTLGQSQFAGDMLALLAGLTWAFYMIISKRIVDRTDSSVSALTFWVMAMTAVFLVPPSLLLLGTGAASLAGVGGVGWASAVYTGVGCSTVAYLLYTRGLRGLTATVSAVLLLVMILVAAVMDYALFGKGLTPIALAGAGIVLASMVMVNVGKTDKAVEGEAPVH